MRCRWRVCNVQRAETASPLEAVPGRTRVLGRPLRAGPREGLSAKRDARLEGVLVVRFRIDATMRTDRIPLPIPLPAVYEWARRMLAKAQDDR